VKDIAPAFDVLEGQLDALYVVGDPLAVTNRMRLNILALAARLPTMYIAKEHVETGGLISYGPNIPDLLLTPP
jgi:putative ABC transport system substrate-binding protein